MTGKEKCKILKEIRQQIADENDIPLVTEECPYKGKCKGTCPKCETELAYLEKKHMKRKCIGIIVKILIAAAAIAGFLIYGNTILRKEVEEYMDKIMCVGYFSLPNRTVDSDDSFTEWEETEQSDQFTPFEEYQSEEDRFEYVTDNIG